MAILPQGRPSILTLPNCGVESAMERVARGCATEVGESPRRYHRRRSERFVRGQVMGRVGRHPSGARKHALA